MRLSRGQRGRGAGAAIGERGEIGEVGHDLVPGVMSRGNRAEHVLGCVGQGFAGIGGVCACHRNSSARTARRLKEQTDKFGHGEA